MPLDIAQYISPGALPLVPLAIQIAGAGLFATGILNWVAKGLTLGGIYGRPVTMTNFTFYLVSFMALLKFVTRTPNPGWYLMGLCLLHGAFALAFGRLLFGNPPVKG